MTAPAARIDHNVDDLLEGRIIDIPFEEARSREPAHVHIINPQKNFRGKIWIKADENIPLGGEGRYSFVLERNTAKALNRSTEKMLFEGLQRAFRYNRRGIVTLFEEQWLGDWYRGE